MDKIGCFGCKFASATFFWTSDGKMKIDCGKIPEWKAIPEKNTCEHSEKVDWSLKDKQVSEQS